MWLVFLSPPQCGPRGNIIVAESNIWTPCFFDRAIEGIPLFQCPGMQSAGLHAVGKRSWHWSSPRIWIALMSVGMCLHGSCEDKRRTWPCDEALRGK